MTNNNKKLICKLYFNYYDEYEEIIFIYEDGTIFQEGDLLNADAYFEIKNQYASIEEFIEAQLKAGFEII